MSCPDRVCCVWISEKQLNGFYNRDGMCLPRSTKWIFMYFIIIW